MSCTNADIKQGGGDVCALFLPQTKLRYMVGVEGESGIFQHQEQFVNENIDHHFCVCEGITD